MAAGINQWLHDGRIRSRPAGHRHRGGADPRFSGTKTMVTVSTLPGESEVSGKEVLSRSRKIVPNVRYLQEKRFRNQSFPQ